MVINVKLIVLLNFEFILLMLQPDSPDRPETQHELYEKKLINRRHHTELRDLQSLISIWIGQGENEKEKKSLLHGVFAFGHPAKYEPRRTGLNFVDQTIRDAALGYMDFTLNTVFNF